MNAPALAVREVSKTLGVGVTCTPILRGVNLTVAGGEFVAVMGPSGSGKSTLLHLAAGLDQPSRGTIVVSGQDLASLSDDALTLLRRRCIGLIFQSFHLLDVLSAEENVALPLALDGCREREAQARAASALERVGLSHRLHHRPGELSGGEQQRVAIARAVITRPALLLADEPTGNLDRASSGAILELLRSLADEGQSILMVTHDQTAAHVADCIVQMTDGRLSGRDAVRISA